MRIETKIQISKSTLTLLTGIISLFAVGTIVITICAGLGINPFKARTTVFLMSVFMGSIGLAFAALCLNIAANLNLVVDSKLNQLNPEPTRGGLKKWGSILIGIVIFSILVIVLGTISSERRFLNVVHTQAKTLIDENQSLITKLTTLLQDGSPAALKQVGPILKFFENQRKGLPSVTLIYSGIFEDKMALYRINDYFPTSNKEEFSPTYFQCTQKLDCEYLKDFFSGKKMDPLRKFIRDDDSFFIYMPFQSEEAKSRFILLFGREQHYGKYGS